MENQNMMLTARMPGLAFGGRNLELANSFTCWRLDSRQILRVEAENHYSSQWNH